MQTIGLIGGTTWYSTIDYYRIINDQINKKLGGDDTAKLILYSVNYGEIKKFGQQDNWEAITEIISSAAKKVEKAGAGCLLLCANTMHHIFNEVQGAVSIPVIHIADAVATEIQKKNISTVALLGTKYTMGLPFYKERLSTHDIHTIIPDEEGFDMVNTTIYEELGKGIFLPQTKRKYIELINELTRKGSEGIILGCTEIPMLIKQDDCGTPLFDTTFIHAMAAVDFALK
ncbi:MAG TPA: aspartate/glutamate racemase family protein [Chitinophagaceae bacterium]|nr:aspartate/glutamate racemase family protein [Chitinophagaceae bacterium]